MAGLFDGEGSIEDMIRAAAHEVLLASVPPGFEWIEEYKQYYSPEYRYYYDPNTTLYYSPDSLTYYRYNDEARVYDVVECCQPTKWSSRGFRKRAMDAVGEMEFKKFDQESVDVCEVILQMIGKVAKDEYIANPNVAPLPRMVEKRKDQITAEDIKEMLRKKKKHLRILEQPTVFDEHTGEYHALPTTSNDNHQHTNYGQSESEEDDDGEVVGGDERALMMQEENYDQPPCIRVIDRHHRLSIITIAGGYIGSDRDCEIVLSNQLLPERCAEVLYSEEYMCYSITKIEESCIIMVNTNSIQLNHPIDICHGDTVIISGERLDIHVHFGSNTCPTCEPGLYVEEKKEELVDAKYISGELARRKQMKQMMRSYGITPNADLNGPIRKKPAGPSMMNINRGEASSSSNDVYGNCVAKPVQESNRLYPLPQSSASSSSPNVVAASAKPLDSGNVGFKLLKSMGWTEGKGLGKEKQGKVEPVATELKTNRTGLGSGKEKPKTYKETIIEKTKQRFNEKR